MQLNWQSVNLCMIKVWGSTPRISKKKYFCIYYLPFYGKDIKVFILRRQQKVGDVAQLVDHYSNGPNQAQPGDDDKFLSEGRVCFRQEQESSVTAIKFRWFRVLFHNLEDNFKSKSKKWVLPAAQRSALLSLSSLGYRSMYSTSSLHECRIKKETLFLFMNQSCMLTIHLIQTNLLIQI